MRGRRSPKWLALVWVVLWIVFLALPVLYLLEHDRAPPAGDWLGGLDQSIASLLGERYGRWIFGSLWFVSSAALCWRLALSKRRFDLGDAADLHD